MTSPPGETQAGMQEPIVSETLPSEEAKMAMAGVAATMEKPSDFPDIHFDYDKSFIREEDKSILRDVADYLKANPAAAILIEGHCDERGTAEYNIALGERRADSTKSYLVSLGVKPGALSTVSFGEEKPLDPGPSEAAWAKNRRAHFVRR
ncbi:MAG: peptidoglycan-associated lipoprotein Pal [Deltaproteobacteria bacterium]|nr:peptidoglycan-associated lipoprotein Pal [Deltaproteobacteria bacterium]